MAYRRTLQSQHWTSYAEAVTGLLKLGKNSLEDVSKISAKHGVFIERLAQNQPGDATEWIPQEKDEDDMAYFTPVTSEAHDNGFTYRRQGKIGSKAHSQPLPAGPKSGKPGQCPTNGQRVC